jgi:hypothetical protein
VRGPWGRLVVIELPDAYVVAREADPDDWLCRFARSPAFPAREWAENMVRLSNDGPERRQPEGPAR